MIPLLDVALAKRLMTVNPEVELRWSTPEIGLKAPHVVPREGDPAALKTRQGKPGSVLHRPSVPYAKYTSPPTREIGIRGKLAADKLTIDYQRRYGVDVEYEYVVHAYRQTEADDIQRRVLFDAVYEPLVIPILGANHQFRVDVEDVSYKSYGLDTDGTMRRHELTFSFRVLDAFWVMDEAVRTVIYQTLNFYEVFSSGAPVLLETLTIVPEGY